MFVRKSLIALATIAATSSAFAGGIQSSSYNELGFTGHTSVSTKTRAEVAKEAQAFNMNSIASAGLIDQHEAGLIPVITKGNSAKPSTMFTAAEKRAQQDLYIGG